MEYSKQTLAKQVLVLLSAVGSVVFAQEQDVLVVASVLEMGNALMVSAPIR
jgi:hypothetical protein